MLVCPSSPGWCLRHWYGVGAFAWVPSLAWCPGVAWCLGVAWVPSRGVGAFSWRGCLRDEDLWCKVLRACGGTAAVVFLSPSLFCLRPMFCQFFVVRLGFHESEFVLYCARSKFQFEVSDSLQPSQIPGLLDVYSLRTVEAEASEASRFTRLGLNCAWVRTLSSPRSTCAWHVSLTCETFLPTQFGNSGSTSRGAHPHRAARKFSSMSWFFRCRAGRTHCRRNASGKDGRFRRSHLGRSSLVRGILVWTRWAGFGCTAPGGGEFVSTARGSQDGCERCARGGCELALPFPCLRAGRWSRSTGFVVASSDCIQLRAFLATCTFSRRVLLLPFTLANDDEGQLSSSPVRPSRGLTSVERYIEVLITLRACCVPRVVSVLL